MSIPTDKEIFRNTLRHSVTLSPNQTNEGEYVKEQLRKAQGGTVTKWIQGMHLRKGALHAELGVPQGKKIPEKKLEKAEHSRNPTIRRQANFAETAKSFHHK